MGNGGWVRTLLCLLLLASSSLAKSAEDYLHGAFYKYIDNRMQEAGVEVEEGLQNYPDDPKLQNLNDLLKQMKNQQRQDQNQSGGGNNDKNKDSKQNPKDQKDQKDQNGQNKDSKNQGKDSQKKDQQDKNQSPKDSAGQDKNKQPQPKPEDKNGQPPKDFSGKGGQAKRMPGQMSKEEAERLLNSFVDEEKKTQQQRQDAPRKRGTGSGQEDW